MSLKTRSATEFMHVYTDKCIVEHQDTLRNLLKIQDVTQ